MALEHRNFQSNSDAFMRWLKDQDGFISSPKIALADLRYRGAGRGVVALADIDEEVELFSIPHTSVLSATTCRLNEHIPDEIAALPAWLRLVLVLIYEIYQGEASSWFPYISVLPEEVDTLVYWSEAELADLQGSAVLSKIGKEAADEAFVEFLLPIVIKNAHLFQNCAHDIPRDRVDHKEALLEYAHRAASLIMAYAFDLEEEEEGLQEVDDEGFVEDNEENNPKGMVPLADMLNADGEFNNARLYHEERSLTMTSTRKIKKGEEILNDYGPLPRSDLLRRYGYITVNNKQWDVVEISITLLSEAARAIQGLSSESIDERVQFAQDMEVWEETFDISREAGTETFHNAGFDAGLLQTINILSATEDDFEHMRHAGKVPKAAMNLITIEVLLKALGKRRKEFGTTIAEDQTLLQDTAVHGRRRMAIEVRLGEKEIIEVASSYLIQKQAILFTTPSPDVGTQKSSHGDGHKAKRRKM